MSDSLNQQLDLRHVTAADTSGCTTHCKKLILPNTGIAKLCVVVRLGLIEQWGLQCLLMPVISKLSEFGR